MNVQVKTSEVSEKDRQKYSNKEVDMIIRKKHKRWQKQIAAKIDYHNKQEQLFLSYKKAVQLFSNGNLQIDDALLELIVCEDIQKTEKYVTAIIQFTLKNKSV